MELTVSNTRMSDSAKCMTPEETSMPCRGKKEQEFRLDECGEMEEDKKEAGKG